MECPGVVVSYRLFPDEITRLREPKRTKAGPKKKRGRAPIDKVRGLYLGEQGDLYVEILVRLNGVDLLTGAIPLEDVPIVFRCVRNAVKRGHATQRLDFVHRRELRCEVVGDAARLSVVGEDVERHASANVRELYQAVLTAFDDFRAEILRDLPELAEHPVVGTWLLGGIEFL